MLTLKEYDAKHYKKNFGSFKFFSISGVFLLDEGMVQLDKDMAHVVHPFDDNYIQFALLDYTTQYYMNGPNKVFSLGRLAETPEPVTVPTKEFPIRLWLLGSFENDNYSKFYAEKEDALQDLQLLIGCEPLHFNKDIKGFGFIQTGIPGVLQ